MLQARSVPLSVKRLSLESRLRYSSFGLESASIRARSFNYLAAWPVIREDAALRAAVQVRFIVFSNRVWYLRRMQESTKELRAMLRTGYSL